MSRRLATLATCNLNQWSLDFHGNLQRILESIAAAKRSGARYRVGPELEVCGYGCEDHFFELDTVAHCWEALTELLKSDATDDCLCDVGMPVIHRGVMYNCRLLLLNRRVLLIRPKMSLANDGNYREARYFSTWKKHGQVELSPLPQAVLAAAQSGGPGAGGQPPLPYVPFGDGVLRLTDTVLAAETCEELFTPAAPHINLALAGVEIIANGSGSHHQLRKLNTRMDLIREATAKAGGVYLYANQQGCDGGRLYYDGCACIALNGLLLAQGSQFSLADVEVVTATVDLDEVVSHRGAIVSLREQASSSRPPFYVDVDFCLCRPPPPHPRLTPSPSPHPHPNPNPPTPQDLLPRPLLAAAAATAEASATASCGAEVTTAGSGGAGAGAHFPTQPRAPRFNSPEEEIAYGPACWCWDYLRRSGASGFLLPLSGGADSSSTAAIIGAMCQLVAKAVAAGDPQVVEDARRVGQYAQGEPVAPSAQEFASRLLHTVYLGTVNSSKATQARALALAQQVGSHHLSLAIDTVVSALVNLFVAVTGKTPRFRADGGDSAQNLALQNIQARLRMVISFLLAQLLPWVRGKQGWLLVLGSANVDEALRGYLTKYDCSSADINPIGGISKQDLRRFLLWASDHLGYSELRAVYEAEPTAELEPLREGQPPQTDEVDMGMTYEELSVYGRLRKIARCGPVAMFLRCMDMWHDRLAPSVVAAKVKHFFTHYAINRHKTTVLTPSYHAESYSPDDNRFDHRQFLYNIRWPWQYRRIDELVKEMETS
ncbi:hypothetical protein V8C86DRAFT_3017388 [Haematococcus lacustris]